MRRAERQEMATAIDNSSVLYLVKSNITMMVVVIVIMVVIMVFVISIMITMMVVVVIRVA